MPRRWIVYLMALGTMFLWGASFPLTKMALAWLGPTTLAFARWFISASLLLGWLGARGQLAAAGQLLRRDGRTIVWMAFSGITLFCFLENLAMGYTTAINAGVLANLTSVFMVLIGVVRFREILAPLEWLALAAAFLGAILISQGSGHLNLAGSGLQGDVLMVVGSFFGAVYSIGGKQLVRRHAAEVITAVGAAIGALFLLPLAVWEVLGDGSAASAAGAAVAGQFLRLPLGAWAALLLLGLGSGALANLWWLHILDHTTASRAGMALFLIPVISTALSVVALHEPLTLTVVVGAILVLGGIAATQREHAQKRKTQIRNLQSAICNTHDPDT